MYGHLRPYKRLRLACGAVGLWHAAVGCRSKTGIRRTYEKHGGKCASITTQPESAVVLAQSGRNVLRSGLVKLLQHSGDYRPGGRRTRGPSRVGSARLDCRVIRGEILRYGTLIRSRAMTARERSHA
jgi:hypothetical protein